jgi:ribosome-associated protein
MPNDNQLMVEQILKVLDEKKALDPVALDLSEVSDSLEFFVIATGTSAPHLQALERALKEAQKPLAVEGPSQRWLLLNYGPVLVHLMSPEAREYYDLEGLWADARRFPMASSA